MLQETFIAAFTGILF